MNDSVTDDDDDDEPLANSLAIVLYPAMLAATLAGQLLGIGLESLAGSRGFWIPLAFSTAVEAVVGARVGAARAGHPFDVAESRRVSMTYSLVLVGLSLPLGIWVSLSQPTGPAGAGDFWTPLRIGSALAAVVLATFIRWGLMVVLAPRRR